MRELAHLGIRLLEAMFFAGWVGAITVLLLSGIEDLKTIMHKDDAPAR